VQPLSALLARALFAIKRTVTLCVLNLHAQWLDLSRKAMPRSLPPASDATLDPQVTLLLYLAKLARLRSVHEMTPPDARRFVHAHHRMLDCTASALESVRDLELELSKAALRARSYRPHGVGPNAPALVYFHGGGFVLGDLDTHDAPLRVIAERARVVIVSVAYRLAPEHAFPAAAEDAIAAFVWVASQAASLGIDRRRIAVGGDSAGGNLAAAVAQQTLRRHVVQPCLQLLIYPVLDLTQSHPSYQEFAEGYLLTKRSMDWYIGHYLGASGKRDDPLASPLLCRELTGLAPALIVSAGFDPLRDEAHAYAKALQAAGVRVEYRCYSRLLHGFLGMAGGVHAARDALTEIADGLREELYSERPVGRTERGSI
jgi:acetyl esterase